MTETLSQYDDLSQAESNTEGVFDITTAEKIGEEKYESLDINRLHQMSSEIVEGGPVDCLLERLAAVKAEAERELIRIQALMRPLEKVQTQYSLDISKIVTQIGIAGAAVGKSGATGEEITDLATKLIAVNEQLADISSEIDTHRVSEAHQKSRIAQCIASSNDVVAYRESCIADLQSAKQLNASMHGKPGLGLLVPESLLIAPDQNRTISTHYLQRLGESAGNLVEYQLPEAVTAAVSRQTENSTDPPKRERLSPAPISMGNSSGIMTRLRRQNK